MTLFSSEFRSPWALHRTGSYAIRTRRRSPNTLFRFYIFFWKIASKRLHVGSVLGAMFFQNCNCEWKDATTIASKKGTPQDANSDLCPSPEAPWQPPSCARFSEQETTIWARNNNAHFWIHFWVLFLESDISESISGKLFIVDAIWI